jgi:hypothetical protein
MDFVAQCYHMGREYCQSVCLTYFLQLPEEDLEGVTFAIFDNATGEEVGFTVPSDHLAYMAEAEELTTGEGWREFLCCYLSYAVDDLDDALDTRWMEEE